MYLEICHRDILSIPMIIPAKYLNNSIQGHQENLRLLYIEIIT